MLVLYCPTGLLFLADTSGLECNDSTRRLFLIIYCGGELLILSVKKCSSAMRQGGIWQIGSVLCIPILPF